ncbi:hypothetical protein BD410DRAFT_449526 [Rickenella mellea]|uniref:Uncharacterized protein n=1 Tax=Rickenella mellea TaxID=50990 RepID=A0A4Y7PUJ3_9AGAM|nr:hypothetical protein BD410DRAFT_449526 [Rickenella mellea]
MQASFSRHRRNPNANGDIFLKDETDYNKRRSEKGNVGSMQIPYGSEKNCQVQDGWGLVAGGSIPSKAICRWSYRCAIRAYIPATRGHRSDAIVCINGGMESFENSFRYLCGLNC